MRRVSFHAFIAILVLLTTFTAEPASATPAPDGCKGPTPIGGKIGQFLSIPHRRSKLALKCSFNDNTGTSLVSTSYTIHDFNSTLYHNGAGRRVTTSTSTGLGSPTIQLSTTSNGIAGITAWANRTITGPGLGPWTFAKSISVGGLVTLNRPTTASIPAGSVLKLENSIIRAVNDATSSPPGSINVTSPTANFTSADVGLSAAGFGIPAHTTIAAVITPTLAQLSTPASLGSGILRIGDTSVTTTARQITNASTTSNVRINSAAAGFANSSLGGDVGLKVAGVCLNGAAPDYSVPANTYITSVASAVNADTTGGLLTSQTECNLTIGEPSYTAPLDGDQALTQDLELDLDSVALPGLGLDACSAETSEDLPLVATWRNPGSFLGVGTPNQQPASTKAIAQLSFTSQSVATFAAFIIERKALTAGDPIGTVHYDIQFPFHPAPLAMCASTATSNGLGFELVVPSTTLSQLTLPFGYGRPRTDRVRAVLYSPTHSYVSNAYVVNDNLPAFTPATAFTRVCIFPTGCP
ncbi:MAG: hypothetical protein ACT4OV_09470 [Microthrixaceae bacterium]